MIRFCRLLDVSKYFCKSIVAHRKSYSCTRKFGHPFAAATLLAISPDVYSCTGKFGHPCAAATLLAISPDVNNLALCQLLLR